MPEDVTDTPVCSIDGCTEPVKVLSRGWCSAHYQRWQKHKDPEYVAPPKAVRLCSVEGCGNKHCSKGFCRKHMKRFEKHGDPLYVTPLEERAGPTRKKTDAEARAFMVNHGLLPLEPFVSVMSNWRCRCLRCGDEVDPTYNRVQQGGTGCGRCGRIQAGLSSRRDEQEAVDKMLSFGFQPNVPYPLSNRPWPGVCLVCGQPGSPSLATTEQTNSACGYCSKVKVDDAIVIGKTLACDWLPLEPYTTAKARWKCKCLKCGDIDYPSYDVIRGGAGCNACARKANGLANAQKIVTRSHERCRKKAENRNYTVVGFEQRVDARGQGISWMRFVCPKGHVGSVRVSAFMQGLGCFGCASKGFNVGKPGVFYVIRDDSIVKCGVANTHSARRRLSKHRGQGLTNFDRALEFESGADTWALERLWKEYVDSFFDRPDMQVPRDRLPDGFREALRASLTVDMFIDDLVALGLETGGRLTDDYWP